jgi:HEPN domain-containing protein
MQKSDDIPEDNEHEVEEPEEPDDPEELNPEVHKKSMRDWFYQHYSDPIHSSPYDSEEGDYVYIFGGPYDPKEELHKEFEGLVPEEIINELADELADISFNWTGNPDAQTLDEYEFDDGDHNLRFAEALEGIELLLATECDILVRKPFFRLLYANVITAIETFLFDFFYSALKSDKNIFRKFIQENEDFKKKKIAFSDVISEYEKLEKTVQEFLTGISWHNIPRIRPLYKNILNLEFEEDMVSDLIFAVTVRHDIVHRNGRSKQENIELKIEKNDVETLIELARKFVNRIDNDWTTLTVFGGQEPPF